MQLTKSLIHSAGSYGGHGFNKAQLNLIGVRWPPKQGWLESLVGKSIPDDTWQKVVGLKGQAQWKLKKVKVAQLQISTAPAIAANTFRVYFDGGTHGFNGKCDDGYGSWEVEWNGFLKTVSREQFLASGVMHKVTNNVAEWLALKCALMWLESVANKERCKVEIYGDSMLVINQLNKRWKSKNKNLAELREHCWHYLKGFNWTAEWQPRAHNVERFGH